MCTALSAARRYVDLRERAERALTGDAHLVAALYFRFDLAFDGQAAVERVFELPRVAAPRISLRDSVSPPTVDTTVAWMRSPTATSSFAVGILQFGEIDRRFALAADVDERDVLADADDPAFDRLTSVDPLRLQRRLEHRREILFLLAHVRLLSPPPRPRNGPWRHYPR